MTPRQTPQPHSHSGPGDGGQIDFPARAGGLTLQDSGTLTVSANGTATEAVAGVSRTDNPSLRAHPNDAWDGSSFRVNAVGADTNAGVAMLQYNPSADQWEVFGEDSKGTELTITWEVYTN